MAEVDRRSASQPGIGCVWKATVSSTAPGESEPSMDFEFDVTANDEEAARAEALAAARAMEVFPAGESLGVTAVKLA